MWELVDNRDGLRVWDTGRSLLASKNPGAILEWDYIDWLVVVHRPSPGATWPCSIVESTCEQYMDDLATLHATHALQGVDGHMDFGTIQYLHNEVFGK